MESSHKHRNVPKLTRTYGFSGCVAPHNCNPASHGGVVDLEECSCGATRSLNINGSHIERGSWTEAAKEAPAGRRDPLREKARELARTLLRAHRSSRGEPLDGYHAARYWLEQVTDSDDRKTASLIIEVGLDALAEAWNSEQRATDPIGY